MPAKKIRITDLKAKKHRGEKITMLTAYDAMMAGIFDQSGIDALLVGDSVGMVMLGHNSTLPVTLDDMVHHTAAVSRGSARALVIADMPFMTYQVSVAEAVRSAGRLLQEGAAAAVKIEGGRSVVDVVRRLVEIGIPVMGHLGVLPQSVHQMGGYSQQGADSKQAETMIADAIVLAEAGAFAIVLESIPGELAHVITERVNIPTIGIGAGPDCDGQVLVSSDMLGLGGSVVPPFATQYVNIGDVIRSATRAYIEDVESGRYPAHIRPTRITIAK